MRLHKTNIPLTTQRLSLYPISVEHIKALETDRSKLGHLTGLKIPETWPATDTAKMLPWMKKTLSSSPDMYGWLGWIIAERKSQTVVGDAGFTGKPDRYATVCLGYSILDEYQRMGYATEAAQKLISWAFSHESVRSVSAQTQPNATASIRVLKKTGMHRVAATKQIIHWELDRNTFYNIRSSDINCDGKEDE